MSSKVEAKDTARAKKRMTMADRVAALFAELGIEVAHFGASAPAELIPLISARPEALASMVLLNASRLPREATDPLTGRLILFAGDSGSSGEALARAGGTLLGAEVHQFEGYAATEWSDMAADRADRIGPAMAEFLARMQAAMPATAIAADGASGKAGGLTYTVTGRGPALVLFPAVLAPSQWNPLVAELSRHFSVIRLGGPNMGIVSVLEARGQDVTWRRNLRAMLIDGGVTGNDRLLEVGCGTGVIARWIAGEGLAARPVTAVDLNPFLLGEAAALARRDGVADAIDFREGNAEALPFEDNSFDAILSVTVIEECDADRAIGEMLRVVKPGGRVMVQVRACDMNVLWSVPPVDEEIRRKAEQPVHEVSPGGCADVSLSTRFRAAGMENVLAFAGYHGGSIVRALYEPASMAHLDEGEVKAWREAKSQAADGTYYMMHPVHCAIGWKPAA